MVSFEEAAVPVHDREFYRMLVEEGLLPATFDWQGMRLPGDPPPAEELTAAELARLVRDQVEPPAWAGLDAPPPSWDRCPGSLSA